MNISGCSRFLFQVDADMSLGPKKPESQIYFANYTTIITEKEYTIDEVQLHLCQAAWSLTTLT